MHKPLSVGEARAGADCRGCAGLDTFALYRAWWADVGPRRSADTCRQYRYFVLRTLADVPKDPREITTGQLDRYLGDLTPANAKAVKAALGDFFAWIQRSGWRNDNPLDKTKRQKPGRARVKRGWSEEELYRVFQAAIWIGDRGRRGTGEGLAWAILGQYAFGLRPGEWTGLRWDNVNLNGAASCIYVTHTKTGNDRVVPIEALGRRALEELRQRSPNAKVVPVGRTQYWAKVRAAAELAGLPPEKSRPYALRHSFASRLVEKGVHIRVIAELLGHVDMRATMTYTTPGDEQLRQAVRLLENSPSMPT